MEEDGLRFLRPRERERGAALVVVVVALAVLLPLALMLSQLVIRRHRQLNVFRENHVGEAAVRGGLHLAMARLRSGAITLQPDQAESFEVEDPRVRVRVSREPDRLLALNGQVLPAQRSSGLDPKRIGIDGEGRLVRAYRTLEIYLVEAEASARAPFPGVRLLGVVTRLDDGEVLCLGLRYDRGYF